MKSKRVAKLMSCMLTVAMTASPVLASNSGANGTVNMDVTLNEATVEVQVPVAPQLKVNPLYDDTQPSVNAYRFASKNISVNNLTKDANGTGLKVLVTAKAKLTKGSDVTVYYDHGASSFSGFVADDKSVGKEIYMELQTGRATASTNADDYKGSDSAVSILNGQCQTSPSVSSATITTQGSAMQLLVPAPTVTNKVVTTFGYGEFAIVGDANTNADWTNNGVKVELTWNIKATGGATPSNAPVSTNQANGHNYVLTGTSANGIAASQNQTFVKKSDLNGGNVTGLVLYDPKGKDPEYTIPASAIEWKVYNEGTANESYGVTIAKDEPGIAWLGSSKTGKNFGLLVVFSDGRVTKSIIRID